MKVTKVKTQRRIKVSSSIVWFLKVDILKVLFHHHHPILRQKQPTIDWWWRRPKGEKRCSLLWRLNTREPYQEREHFALGFFSVSPRKLRSILAENVAFLFLRLFSDFQIHCVVHWYKLSCFLAQSFMSRKTAIGVQLTLASQVKHKKDSAQLPLKNSYGFFARSFGR